MKTRSTLRTCAGFISMIELIIFLAIACFIFSALTYVIGSEKIKQHKREDCQAFSASVMEIQERRNDVFVVDVSRLHALYKTQQPVGFWFKRIAGENSLIEGGDYVLVGAEENRSSLLSIDAAQGIASKTIENGNGFFLSSETRGAERVLECLQKIEVNTP